MPARAKMKNRSRLALFLLAVVAVVAALALLMAAYIPSRGASSPNGQQLIRQKETVVSTQAPMQVRGEQPYDKVVRVVQQRLNAAATEAGGQLQFFVLGEEIREESRMCPTTCMRTKPTKDNCKKWGTSPLDQSGYFAAAGFADLRDPKGLSGIGMLPKDFRTSITAEAGFASEWAILDALQRQQAAALRSSVATKTSSSALATTGWAAGPEQADLIVLPLHTQSIALAALKIERTAEVPMSPSIKTRVCADTMAHVVRRVLRRPYLARRWEQSGGADFIIVTGGGRSLNEVLLGMQTDIPQTPKAGAGWNLTAKHLASSGMDWREWAIDHAKWAWRDLKTCRTWMQHVFGLHGAIFATVAPSYPLGLGFRAHKDVGTIGRYALKSTHRWPPLQNRPVTMTFVGSVLYPKHESSSYSQGVRQSGLRLYGHMNEETDGVVYVNGRVSGYMDLLKRSKFCLYLPGWHPNLWSHRLVDMLVSGCVPAVVQDNVEMPFREFIPWHLASVRVNYAMFRQGKLLPILRAIPDSKVREMMEGVRAIAEMLNFYGVARGPTDALYRADFTGPSAVDILRAAITKNYVEQGTVKSQGRAHVDPL